MTALKTENNQDKNLKNSLATNYSWFYSNIYSKVQKSVDEFFQKDFKLRFMGISYEENIFFYGDEYFVNKLPVNKTSSIMMRVSSNLVSSLLDNSLGVSETKFELKTLTEIEAGLIKSFTVFVYKNIEDYLNKTEVNRKITESAKDYNFTFFVRFKNKHTGKIILTIPEYMLPKIEPEKIPERFEISDFKGTMVALKISVGSTKLALNEIKEIEDGDIIVLENSDINKMSVLWGNNEIKFRINPNPSLIISIDNNGDNEMEEETNVKPQNMWDSILVDVIAEFDNVKLTLGELKQISEGLVIDVGSVYDNKIKLRVENQVVATGELVILNDRYGVRIDNVKKTKEEAAKQPISAKGKEVKTENANPTDATPEVKNPAPRPMPAGAAKRPSSSDKRPVRPNAPAQPNTQSAAKQADGNENFDYSDFEIEDESI